jgi:hypothetical protein
MVWACGRPFPVAGAARGVLIQLPRYLCRPAARRRAYGAFASPRNPGLRADPAARIADSVPFSSAAAQLQKLTFRN